MMPFKTNLLLESLPPGERDALQPHLRPEELPQHRILFDIHDTIDAVYFPIGVAVSLVIPLSTGEIVETAMVGRDGAIGAAAALNGRLSLNRAIVQIGGDCLVGAHEQSLFAQAQQSAACNATHVIESRFARWLLRAADLCGGNELPLTQEYIAQMLGVRRTSVTLVARTLQEAGMIRYARGHIKLLDAPALQETACECYRTVKTNYDNI